MNRRSFLAASAAAWLLPGVGALAEGVGAARMRAPRKLQSFDYRGVTLLPSRFREQYDGARDLYFNLSDEDMLKGFRRNAKLPAPGDDMKGWCTRDCAATFGQWISGMARMHRATGDTAMRDKAVFLVDEWEKTIGRDGDTSMHNWATYGWEKMSCGLVDLAYYGDHAPALDVLERITRWGYRHFDRSRSPAIPVDRDGRRPKGTLEWYTLAENSLRAYGLTGNRLYLDFAKLWVYPEYWDQFVASPRPPNAGLRHSYSHMNTFGSVAMLYAVTGDPRYLTILRNAHDWARDTQTYASGGFGPGEWSVPADGTLGRALEMRVDTAEIPCGAWAGFKLSRYLTEFTGEARYGDWVETLLFNGIGAALPLQPDGRAFYYADYRIGMAFKTYFWDEWPCCSGSYIQAITDYHNVIYYRDDDGLYVSQAVPSRVEWQHAGQSVRVTQHTRYPEAEHSELTIELAAPAEFALRIRVPSWAKRGSVRVNGEALELAIEPDEWARIDRVWHSGDVVTYAFPMELRAMPVDAQHPNRIAVLYGPVQLAQEARFGYPISGTAEQALSRLRRRKDTLEFEDRDADADIERHGGQPVTPFKPLYAYGERQPYRAYFDLDRPRFI